MRPPGGEEGGFSIVQLARDLMTEHPRHPLPSELALMTLPQMLSMYDGLAEAAEREAYGRAVRDTLRGLGV